MQKKHTPRAIPREHGTNDACVAYVVANLRNDPKYYEIQRTRELGRISLCAAGRYFDFWTEVMILTAGAIPTVADLLETLGHMRQYVADKGEQYASFVVHSIIPNPRQYATDTVAHCTGLLVGARNLFVIDALNGIACFDYDNPDDMRALLTFGHLKRAARIAAEIDNRAPSLAFMRFYTELELGHIIHAPEMYAPRASKRN